MPSFVSCLKRLPSPLLGLATLFALNPNCNATVGSTWGSACTCFYSSSEEPVNSWLLSVATPNAETEDGGAGSMQRNDLALELLVDVHTLSCHSAPQ